MGLFGSSQISYLGVDLGSGNVKVLELFNESGKPKLHTYGYIELPFDEIGEHILASPKKASAILKKITTESKTKSKSVVAALPVSSVFSTIINLPQVTKKELASPRNLAPLIHWEAKKLIPLPLDEMILDWQILPVESAKLLEKSEETEDKKQNNEKEDKIVKNTRVLLTAASKDLVSKYINVFKLAGLSLLNLETDIFALVRSLVGHDKSTIMIVDIGARTTNLSIVDNTIPYLNKSINLGGSDFSKSISKQIGVEINQAEQFKMDLGSTKQKDFPKVLSDRLVDLENEIKYSVNLFTSSYSNKSIEKVILTGGSSLLPGLSEHLTQSLGIRVFTGDPWARVIYPEDLRPVLDEIGPKFSVSIGLAMRNIVK